MTFRLAAAGATACTVLLAGCGSGGYYMVRDPGSATTYYTNNIGTAGSALQFKDARTGSAVTLQNSELKQISKEEFTQGITAPAPAPAAAVAAPVPAATVGAQSPAAPYAAPLPSGAGASAPAPQAKPQ